MATKRSIWSVFGNGTSRGVMACVLCGCAGLVCVAGPAVAQDTPAAAEVPAEANPTAEELFERHVEAVGGADLVFAQSQRRIVGRFESRPAGVEGAPPSFAARLEVVQQAPAKLRITLDQPGRPAIVTTYDGEIGWSKIGDGDASLIFGRSLLDLAMSADFYGEAQYRDRYRELKEPTAIKLRDGRNAWRVDYVSRYGKPGAVFFDADNGLAIAVQSLQTRGDDGVPMLVELEDYQPIGDDGPLYPRVVRQTTPEAISTMTYRRISESFDEPVTWSRPPEVTEVFNELQRQRAEREGEGG